MKRIIRYTIYTAVVCLLFLPSWASVPDDIYFSDKLASLDIEKAHRVNSFSGQHRNISRYAPVPNPQPQAKPISEPAMIFILGIVLIGLSAAGKKMIKY